MAGRVPARKHLPGFLTPLPPYAKKEALPHSLKLSQKAEWPEGQV